MTENITQTSSFNQKLLTVLDSKSIVQDRLPGDVLTLPHNIHEIKVSVNDFVVSDTINYSLEKLYDNWLYLVSSSIIPSNNIPNADYYTDIITDTPTEGLDWYDSTRFPEISSTTSNRSLSGIKKISTRRVWRRVRLETRRGRRLETRPSEDAPSVSRRARLETRRQRVSRRGRLETGRGILRRPHLETRPDSSLKTTH